MQMIKVNQKAEEKVETNSCIENSVFCLGICLFQCTLLIFYLMDGARERLVWRRRRPLPSFEGNWVKGRRRQTFRDMLFTIDRSQVCRSGRRKGEGSVL